MKIIAAAALIASSFTPITLPLLVAAAAANPSNGNSCNFTMSSSAGWSCENTSSSDTYYSVGQGSLSGGDLEVTCQDYVRTNSSGQGYNPAGHAVPAFSSSSTSDTPIGSPYTTSGGCNYPPGP